MTSSLTIDFHEARRLTTALCGDCTFQTFRDSPDALVVPQILQATIASIDVALKELAEQNRRGAGVFVCVNQTDGQGRKAENVTKVRAVFVDLDGAPFANIYRYGLEPTVIVESAPGRFHAYGVFADGVNFPLGAFEQTQRRLAALMDGDRVVCDLPRVMRLPGFGRQKGEPFQTRVLLWDVLVFQPDPAAALAAPGHAAVERGQTDCGLGQHRRGRDEPAAHHRQLFWELGVLARRDQLGQLRPVLGAAGRHRRRRRGGLSDALRRIRLRQRSRLLLPGPQPEGPGRRLL